MFEMVGAVFWEHIPPTNMMTCRVAMQATLKTALILVDMNIGMGILTCLNFL